MTTQSKTPSTRVNDVARLMADDDSCAHSVWYLSRHSRLLSTRADRSAAIDGAPRRTSLIRKIAAGLEEHGHETHPSLRNHFEARGSRTGARVSGRPDLISRGPNGTITVYDVRDGEPTERDDLRVRIHMYLLPRSNQGRWRGSSPDGCIVYPDGTERRIEAQEIDEEFVDRVAAVMRQITSDEPARYRPSAAECGRCPLTSEHCSERVEVVPESPGNVELGNPSTSC